MLSQSSISAKIAQNKIQGDIFKGRENDNAWLLTYLYLTNESFQVDNQCVCPFTIYAHPSSPNYLCPPSIAKNSFSLIK